MDVEFYLLLQRCFAPTSDCRPRHGQSRHLSSELLWQSIRSSLYTVSTAPAGQYNNRRRHLIFTKSLYLLITYRYWSQHFLVFFINYILYYLFMK